MDLDEQLALARWAVGLVERDIHATLARPPLIVVDLYEDRALRIQCNGGYQVPSMSATAPVPALAEVADYLQWAMSDNKMIWPTCPEHSWGLHATADRASAVWRCSAGPHDVARIGHLGDVPS